MPENTRDAPEGTQMTTVERLSEGDLIDLAPLLSDALARPWVWTPFGGDSVEAVESARTLAEYELATVESVQAGPWGETILYTDQINVTVPSGYLVERTGE